jgi:hemerythrin-like metal-binding protein
MGAQCNERSACPSASHASGCVEIGGFLRWIKTLWLRGCQADTQPQEPEMNAAIEWSDALLLDFEPMDQSHREFVALLASAQLADDTRLKACWHAVTEHTQQFFRREDEWMRQSHFAHAGTHMLQHRVVLNVMREGLQMAQTGQFAPLREMANELAAWFLKHTQSLDAALALHLRGEPQASPA